MSRGDDDDDDDDDRGVCVCRSDHFWLRLRNVVSWRFSETFGMNILTLYPKTKAPYNVTVYKGSNQAALTRAFVLYFLYRYISYTRERVKFKVACLVRQTLSGQAPLYLAEDCCLVSDSTRRSLRSADVST